MRRIIIIRPGALGDALLVLPALAALRARWPAAHLIVITRSDVLSLLIASGLADATYPYDLPEWAGLWADAPESQPLVARTFAGADALVAWLGDDDGTLRRNAVALGISRTVIVRGRPSPEVNEHAAEYLLRTLAPLGLPADCMTRTETVGRLPLLRATAAESAAVERRWDALGLTGRSVVALHPGSGGAHKRWPPDRFAALASAVAAQGLVPLVLEGPADAEAVRGMIAGPASPSPLTVLRGATLDELAAMLAHCSAYVGNDSGVTHLAALVGCPTVALFGPSDPSVWSPVGRTVRVLRADDTRLAPMLALPVGRVERALLAMLQAAEAGGSGAG